MPKSTTLLPAFLLFLFHLPALQAGEWSGYLSLEARVFNHDPLYTEQHQNNLSFSVQPEYHTRWNKRHNFTFTPFFRLDQHDSNRTHSDIRELIWSTYGRDWEIKAGIGKVFWGVTESQHLVDIVNQTDMVENLDGEDKLGQPMLNLTLIRNWGNLDLFILPRFREQTYTGFHGRLRSPLPIDDTQTGYESDKKKRHIDYALRWFKTVGLWDIGLSHFYGTNRTPSLSTGLDDNGNPVLIPYYNLIHQTGLDIQATMGDWLWKLETIHHRSKSEKYNALTAGFEYTLVGIGSTSKDLGLIMEYLYDNRDDKPYVPFYDHVMLGTRFVFNDVQSTEILLGVIINRDHSDRIYSIEASRRLTDNWKLSVEGRIFSGVRPATPFYSLRNDDYLQIELAYYF
jgi:hypothetical protein